MNKEREKAILQLLIQNKKVTVKELAVRLYASEPSIRRDLFSLERQQLLHRVHGGAILDENGISEIKIPFVIRELEHSNEKIIIAKKAADLINDNAAIFIDASSSAYNIIPFLLQKKNITVITNGIKALSKLSEYNIRSIGTGGNTVNSCLAMVGTDAFRTIQCYNADFCFFSCRGLSENGYLTDISVEENLVRQEMISHSAKSYLLCSGDKIGKTYYHNLCSVKVLSGIISDIEIPENIRNMMAGN